MSSIISKGKSLAFQLLTDTIGLSELETTILVAGAPRSGTTWLAEMLSRLPKYKLLNEPLLIHNNPSAVQHGIDWRTFVAPGDNRPRLERYLQKVFAGRIGLGPWWHFKSENRIGKLREHVRCPCLVVKLCRAGRMLNWITSRFPLRGTIFIIRHPCAVVSSMLERGGWPVLEPDSYAGQNRTPEALLLELPDDLLEDYGDFLRNLDTHHEILAATWCLDHYIPLVYDRNERGEWHAVRYEELVLSPGEVIGEISDYLSEEISLKMVKHKASSKYSSNSLKKDEPQKQLEKWKFKLTGKKIKDIKNVVNKFSLGKYL